MDGQERPIQAALDGTHNSLFLFECEQKHLGTSQQELRSVGLSYFSFGEKERNMIYLLIKST